MLTALVVLLLDRLPPGDLIKLSGEHLAQRGRQEQLRTERLIARLGCL